MKRPSLRRCLLVLSASMLASCGGGSGSSATGPTLAFIALSPLAVSLQPGDSTRLTVTGTYSDGATAVLPPGNETFQSSDTGVATVAADGVVSVAAGAIAGETVTITATDNASGLTTSLADSTVVTIEPADITLAFITLSPLAVSLQPGDSTQLTVTGTYSDGATAALPAGNETFQSSDIGVATVAADGVVSVAAGAIAGETVTITATDNASGLTTSLADSTIVTVEPADIEPPLPSGFIFSPYKDVAIGTYWNSLVLGTHVTGTQLPIVGPGSLIATRLPGLKAITLAFATGQCGNETWAGIPPQALADANISALDAAGVNYIISTGGVAGSFQCSDPAGMVAFISRYMSPHMVGVDFDIERGQTQAQINALVSQAAYAEDIYPELRFSFTLATLAAADGSYAGLNATGAMVVNVIKNSSLEHYTINLMVMDYGPASPFVCVVVNGVCDMGQSAIQAVVNLEHSFGIPASRIELTPMLGVNDIRDEVFTPDDMDTVVNYATDHGLAGLHFWSLDRDTPCDVNYNSPTCNSLPTTEVLEYTDRVIQILGQ